MVWDIYLLGNKHYSAAVRSKKFFSTSDLVLNYGKRFAKMELASACVFDFLLLRCPCLGIDISRFLSLLIYLYSDLFQ